jgi:hypothetical protein
VIIGAFAVTYVNLVFLRWAGEFINPPMQAIGDATGIGLLEHFNLVNYNFLIFGVVLAVMMVKRPEGLFPVETAKAEMHGIGISGVAIDTGGDTIDELGGDEEIDEEHHPTSAAEAALGADTPPEYIREHDLPEDTR